MMLIASVQGAMNQTAVKAASGEKGASSKVEGGASFLSAVAEVAQTVSGKILVAPGAELTGMNFLKQKSEFEKTGPDKIETVYDFISEIESIIKKNKKRG